MASSKIDVFAFNHEEATGSLLHPIADVHNTRRNAPCNCRDCLPFFFIHGAGTMQIAKMPATGEEVFVPALTEDGCYVFALSANFYKKHFAKDCNYDMAIFASHVIERKWRAYTKPVVSSSVAFTDVKKRKAPDTPSAPRKAANTEIAAVAMMPQPPAAAGPVLNDDGTIAQVVVNRDGTVARADVGPNHEGDDDDNERRDSDDDEHEGEVF